MIKFFYCISCDFNFSVVLTGSEPKVKCPKCHAGCPKRIYQKYNNSVKGMILKRGDADVL